MMGKAHQNWGHKGGTRGGMPIRPAPKGSGGKAGQGKRSKLKGEPPSKTNKK